MVKGQGQKSKVKVKGEGPYFISPGVHTSNVTWMFLCKHKDRDGKKY